METGRANLATVQ